MTIDFVTDLPESTASGYTGIAVIVGRFTKYAVYLLCFKDIGSPELAKMFIENVICHNGIPISQTGIRNSRVAFGNGSAAI